MRMLDSKHLVKLPVTRRCAGRISCGIEIMRNDAPRVTYGPVTGLDSTLVNVALPFWLIAGRPNVTLAVQRVQVADPQSDCLVPPLAEPRAMNTSAW